MDDLQSQSLQIDQKGWLDYVGACTGLVKNLLTQSESRLVGVYGKTVEVAILTEKQQLLNRYLTKVEKTLSEYFRHDLIIKFVAADESSAFISDKNTQIQSIRSDENGYGEQLEFKLPYYDGYSALPNLILRSAIFGVSQTRVYVVSKQLFSQGETIIYYTGWTMNQTDLKVWDALVRIYGRKKITNSILVITYYELIKELNKSSCGQTIVDINDCIDRLKSTELNIRHVSKKNVNGKMRRIKYDFLGNLINGREKIKIDDNKNEYLRIEFNKKLFELFAPGHYSTLNRKVIEDLGKKQVATRLFHFYSTHEKSYALSLDYLAQLCDKEPNRESRRAVRDGLSELKVALKNNDLTFSYLIENDVVTIVKKPFGITKK